jgi:thiosulfate dehydrogenase (quinone) large subunit
VTRPDRWLVLLRVVVGAWFVKAVWTKFTLGLLWDVIPYPTVSPRFLAFHPKRIAEFAAGNPVDWYKEFLEQTVLPNSRVFATLQAFGEAAVGLGLILGLLTGLTALVGLFLSLNYGLASQWMSFGQHGFHVLLVTSMIIFLFARAGRKWGLDGWILARDGRQRHAEAVVANAPIPSRTRPPAMSTPSALETPVAVPRCAECAAARARAEG